MATDICFERLSKALEKKKIPPEAIQNVLKEVDEFIQANKELSPSELRKKLYEFRVLQSAKFKRQELSILLDKKKFLSMWKEMSDRTEGSNIVESFKTMFRGGFFPSKGSSLSIDRIRQAYADELRTPLMKLAAEQKPIYNAYEKGLYDDDIMRYLWYRNEHQARNLGSVSKEGFQLPDGVNIPRDARLVAEQVHGSNFLAFKRLKEAGSTIEFDANYTARRIYDPAKIDAKRGEFIEDIMRLRHKNMFPEDMGEENMASIANDMVNNIIKSEVEKGTQDGEVFKEMLSYKTTGAYDKRISKRKAIRLASPEAEIEMRKKWGGDRTIADATNSMIFARSRQISMLEKFGSNPRAAYGNLKRMALWDAYNTTLSREGSEAALKAKDEVRKSLGGIDNLFADAMGDTTRAAEKWYAKAAINAITLNNLRFLGSTAVYAITDAATSAAMMSQLNGKNMFSNMLTYSAAFAKTITPSRRAAVANKFQMYIDDDLLGRVNVAGFDESRPGAMSRRMSKWFFTANGLRAQTEAARFSMMRQVSTIFADMKDLSFKQMDQSTLDNGFLRYGIDEKEWDIMRNYGVGTFDEYNVKAITPDDIANIPDSAITRDIGENVDPTKFRDDLNRKYKVMLREYAEFGSPQPGSRERALLSQGTDINTPLGAGLRVIMQFKSFPLTMDTIMRRVIQDNQSATTLGKGMASFNGMKKMGQFAANGMIAAWAAQSVSDALRNKTPLDPTAPENWIPLLTRSGVGGILADSMLMDHTSYGGSAAKFLGGPSMDLIDRIIKPVQSAAKIPFLEEGKDQNKAIRDTQRGIIGWNRLIPGNNLPYVKAGLMHWTLDAWRDDLFPIGAEKAYQRQQKQERFGDTNFIFDTERVIR